VPGDDEHTTGFHAMRHALHVADIGIRFIVEPAGTELREDEKVALRDLKPAGIMFRRRNFRHDLPYDQWLQLYAGLLADCRDAIGRESIIISVDHEGGAVHRFPTPITRFPYAATYGAEPGAVREVASAMGEELAALGVNLSFSPVADIHSNPRNPVINERAFGVDPQQVTKAAIACMQGLQQHGVVACAKHFPGHGDTGEDSHYALPTVAHSQQQLEQRELLPFKALIEEGIELIMSAHIMVPALDPMNQATVSSAILTDLLRTKLGFHGLVIADALGMKGIHDTLISGAFTVQAHRAGLDLFLVVGDTVSIADALSLRDEFAKALEDGEIELNTVLTTEQRIRRFLDALPQHHVRELPPETLLRHAALAQRLAGNAPWSRFVFDPVGFD
jgi:beta-N-acetylhexosaminidase